MPATALPDRLLATGEARRRSKIALFNLARRNAEGTRREGLVIAIVAHENVQDRGTRPPSVTFYGMQFLTENDLTALAEADLLRRYFLCGDAGDAMNDAIASEIERRAAERRLDSDALHWT